MTVSQGSPIRTGWEQDEVQREAREGAFCGSREEFKKGVGDSGNCPEILSRIGPVSIHSVCNWQVIDASQFQQDAQQPAWDDLG